MNCKLRIKQTIALALGLCIANTSFITPLFCKHDANAPYESNDEEQPEEEEEHDEEQPEEEGNREENLADPRNLPFFLIACVTNPQFSEATQRLLNALPNEAAQDILRTPTMLGNTLLMAALSVPNNLANIRALLGKIYALGMCGHAFSAENNENQTAMSIAARTSTLYVIVILQYTLALEPMNSNLSQEGPFYTLLHEYIALQRLAQPPIPEGLRTLYTSCLTLPPQVIQRLLSAIWEQIVQ